MRCLTGSASSVRDILGNNLCGPFSFRISQSSQISDMPLTSLFCFCAGPIRELSMFMEQSRLGHRGLFTLVSVLEISPRVLMVAVETKVCFLGDYICDMSFLILPAKPHCGNSLPGVSKRKIQYSLYVLNQLENHR